MASTTGAPRFSLPCIKADAGWVNGNFFVIPRGAKSTAGAWEFMKFWSGLGGQAEEAARICEEGGWIPVSPKVVHTIRFQAYLAREPLFAEFVRLAASEQQLPVPVVPGAAFIRREIERIGEVALYNDHSPTPAELLAEAARNIQRHLARQQRSSP